MNHVAGVSESVLELHDLDVTFASGDRPVPIVTNVSFAIAAGETLGLVGESGSGKSTVANAIARLISAHARPQVTGSIIFAGHELLRLSESAMRSMRGSEIAMIPQDPMASLNPLFTIGYQLAEAIAMQGRLDRRAMRAAVIDLLRLVRIDSPETRIDQYPHELSGGMRQRVVGAIAMARSPRLLLADEPTTALDVTVQAQYLDLLSELQRSQGMAMLFITHDLGVVARIADRVAVIYAGRIVELASAATIFSRPAHWYTQALLDSMPGLGPVASRLRSIAGSPLRPGARVSGCRFAARCPNAEDRCRQQEPALEGRGAEHEVRCWYPLSGAGSA